MSNPTPILDDILVDFFNPYTQGTAKNLPATYKSMELYPNCTLSFQVEGGSYLVSKRFKSVKTASISGRVPTLEVTYKPEGGEVSNANTLGDRLTPGKWPQRRFNFHYIDSTEQHNQLFSELRRYGAYGVTALEEVLHQLLHVAQGTALSRFLLQANEAMLTKVHNDPINPETGETWEELYGTFPTLGELLNLPQSAKSGFSFSDSDYLAHDIFKVTYGMVTPVADTLRTTGAEYYLLPNGEVLYVNFDHMSLTVLPFNTVQHKHVAVFSDRDTIEEAWLTGEDI